MSPVDKSAPAANPEDLNWQQDTRKVALCLKSLIALLPTDDSAEGHTSPCPISSMMVQGDTMQEHFREILVLARSFSPTPSMKEALDVSDFQGQSSYGIPVSFE
jgi:hypothetical protein